MKIGILTYHYAHNYGAVLQCYALQEYLVSLGHRVYVINHVNKNITKDYVVFDIQRFIMKNPFVFFKRIKHEFKYYSIRKNRYSAFESFIRERINVVAVNEITEYPFDLIIVGSDQVWNYNLTNGFDPYYWGEFRRPAVTKLATYAASMQDSWPIEIDGELMRRLPNFDFLSVREQNLIGRFKLLTNQKISLVVDPTLLFSMNDWNKVAENPQIETSYLLLYQVDVDDLAERTARKIAIEYNLQIIRLYAQPDKPHSSTVSNCSPSKFVGLFKHADFVVCSSFHGTVFSILYKKPFYTIKISGKSSRVENLLSKMELSSFLIDEVPDKISKVKYNHISSDISKSSKEYIKLITNCNE